MNIIRKLKISLILDCEVLLTKQEQLLYDYFDYKMSNIEIENNCYNTALLFRYDHCNFFIYD